MKTFLKIFAVARAFAGCTQKGNANGSTFLRSDGVIVSDLQHCVREILEAKTRRQRDPSQSQRRSDKQAQSSSNGTRSRRSHARAPRMTLTYCATSRNFARRLQKRLPEHSTPYTSTIVSRAQREIRNTFRLTTVEARAFLSFVPNPKSPRSAAGLISLTLYALEKK